MELELEGPLWGGIYIWVVGGGMPAKFKTRGVILSSRRSGRSSQRSECPGVNGVMLRGTITVPSAKSGLCDSIPKRLARYQVIHTPLRHHSSSPWMYFQSATTLQKVHPTPTPLMCHYLDPVLLLLNVLAIHIDGLDLSSAHDRVLDLCSITVQGHGNSGKVGIVVDAHMTLE